jgi:hypothetical protein
MSRPWALWGTPPGLLLGCTVITTPSGGSCTGPPRTSWPGWAPAGSPLPGAYAPQEIWSRPHSPGVAEAFGVGPRQTPGRDIRVLQTAVSPDSGNDRVNWLRGSTPPCRHERAR